MKKKNNNRISKTFLKIQKTFFFNFLKTIKIFFLKIQKTFWKNFWKMKNGKINWKI